MATLATFIQDTSARRNSRAMRAGRNDANTVAAERSSQLDAVRDRAIRLQEDACLLRALPNDGIYFYSKKIDNSRIVRQADPTARGECWSVVGAAGVLLMLGVSIIAPHVGAVLAGYKLEALKQERQSLVNQKRDLDVQEAGLLSPERLNGLARLRSLASPGLDRVIHLEAPAADGNFARNVSAPDRQSPLSAR
jgi:cell division protein FtsL